MAEHSLPHYLPASESGFKKKKKKKNEVRVEPDERIQKVEARSATEAVITDERIS